MLADNHKRLQSSAKAQPIIPTPMPTGLKEAVGRNVRRIRKAQGMSQSALAEKAGLHKNTILFLEKGTIPSLRLDTLEAIANALSVDAMELLQMPAGESPAGPFIDRFLASPYAEILKLKPDEIEWLRSSPMLRWVGAEPDEEAIFHVVQAHRKAQGGDSK